MQFPLLQKWKNEVLHFFFPKLCIVCGVEESKICNECFSNFETSPEVKIDNIDVLSCFNYGNGVSSIMQNIKYHNKTEFSKVIASYIMQLYRVELQKGDIFIPIPNHFLGQIKRKYNIPNLICLHLKTQLNIKILNILLKTNLKSQVGLNKKQRLKNAVNFFTIKSQFGNKNILQDKTVILIDDVMTTGATIRAAIKEVAKLNPAKIKVITFATRNLTFNG